MIKEELGKKVEEYLENKHCKNVCICDEIKECKEGIRIRCTSFNYRKGLIVDFVEPREKRIEELEEENNKLLDVINNQDVTIADLEQQIEKMKNDVKQGQSYWNSGEMQYHLYQRLLDKWEIKENDIV